MPRPRKPHIVRQVDRHGNTAWYYRKGHGKRIRLRGAYGSAEFEAAYEAAERGEAPPAASRPGAGTLAWLVSRHQDSLAWSEMAEATRRQRANVLKRILAESGSVAFARIERKHVTDGIDRRRARPAAARHFLEALRGLFKWALAAGLAAADPTAGVRTPRKRSDGHHVWTEEECTRYEARWPLGTRERLAFDVLLYTGLRRGDAVRLGRQHVRGGEATIRTDKTGEVVTIPLLAPLLASITAGPCGDLSFIAGERGQPLTKESFGNWFRRACREAGVPGSAHGLRKAGATRAADAGGSEYELMALYGWTSPRTAAIYTRKANREKLSRSGSEKLAKARG
jgi:integrase